MRSILVHSIPSVQTCRFVHLHRRSLTDQANLKPLYARPSNLAGKQIPFRLPLTQPRKRVQNTGALIGLIYAGVENYAEHFCKLLTLEEMAERDILRDRLTWTVERLVHEGYCIERLNAFWIQQKSPTGRYVARFSLGPGVKLGTHQIEKGIPVVVTRQDTPDHPYEADGAVVGISETQLDISFKIQFDLENFSWRVDMGYKDFNFKMMRKAISLIHNDARILEQPTGSPLLGAESKPDKDSAEESGQNSELLGRLQDPNRIDDANHFGAFRNDTRIHSWAQRYSRSDPLVIQGDPIIKNMNTSQVRAMAMMIGQRLSLVQGPPGTGKTKTIVEAVKLLKSYFQVDHPILLCTYTNAAVDNLVEGLVKAGLKPVRIAPEGRGRAAHSEYNIINKNAAHPRTPEIYRLKDKTADLNKRIKRLSDEIDKQCKAEHDHFKISLKAKTDELRDLEWEMKQSYARLSSLRQEIAQDSIFGADVICTTCLTANHQSFKGIEFPVIFLDEASMSTEPASLIPIMKGSAHVALIGDHKQLPPTIASKEAKQLGLDISLFERLMEEGVTPSILLDTQHRMHPDLSQFPAIEFYDGALRDGTSDSTGNIHPNLSPPISRYLLSSKYGSGPPLIFLDHLGIESKRGVSCVNINEANIVIDIVEDLLLMNPKLNGADIGIISPYAAQISLLTQALTSNAKFKARYKEVLGEARAVQMSNIEVKTVDGFEGREKDIIVFSTVRNNEGGYIGFLADRRRMNVGLTRAKRGLFVVGSINTLAGAHSRKDLQEQLAPTSEVRAGAESWRKYAQYLNEKQLVLHLSVSELGRTFCM